MQSGALLYVNENFEGKRDAEIALLNNSYY